MLAFELEVRSTTTIKKSIVPRSSHGSSILYISFYVLKMIVFVGLIVLTFFVLRHMRWRPLIPSVPSIVLGVLLGIGLAGIGALWSKRNASMLQSITYVVGNDLRSGGIAKLLFISFFAGITEEWPFRGWLALLTVANYRWAGFVLFVVLNYLWALGHITHIGPDARRSLRSALSRSRPHRLIVFLSGFSFAVLVLWTGSLIPAIIAHATLDFAYGLFYRRIRGRGVSALV